MTYQKINTDCGQCGRAVCDCYLELKAINETEKTEQRSLASTCKDSETSKGEKAYPDGS